MFVLIVGGGKVGYYLAKTLLPRGHHVSIIEKEPVKAARLSDELGVLVINGDGTSIQDLADAGADRADIVAAVTGLDEENLAACQLAKRKFGVRRTIARVNNPKNEKVFTLLGVDAAVSSTSIIASLIEREVATDDVKALLAFTRSELVLTEIEISVGSQAANKPIKDLVLPDDCVLVSVIRGGKALFPRGNLVLAPHDMVLAVTTVHSRETLEKSIGKVGK
ncbi:MAG TPA: NAD(P)H-binding protein [Firmicutes bacterium]|nr:NAD(P)H-binding protein [Bacillota bacterium]